MCIGFMSERKTHCCGNKLKLYDGKKVRCFHTMPYRIYGSEFHIIMDCVTSYTQSESEGEREKEEINERR